MMDRLLLVVAQATCSGCSPVSQSPLSGLPPERPFQLNPRLGSEWERVVKAAVAASAASAAATTTTRHRTDMARHRFGGDMPSRRSSRHGPGTVPLDYFASRSKKRLSFISNHKRRKEGTCCSLELAGIEPTPPASLRLQTQIQRRRVC